MYTHHLLDDDHHKFFATCNGAYEMATISRLLKLPSLLSTRASEKYGSTPKES